MTTEPNAIEQHPRGWMRNVVLFLSGQTVSLFGSSLVQYAIVWYLSLETKSGVVLTLATVFGFVPQALISVFGGVWADRHNRKYLIIGADAAIAVSTLALAVLFMQGFEGLWLIYGTLAIRSIGAGIQTPAVGALIPQIVPADKLIRFNGIFMSIQSSMTLLAPAIAAALFAAFGLQAVLFVDVATAVIGIVLVGIIPVTKIARTTEQAGYFGDLIEGLRYIRSHKVILRVLVFFAIVFFLAAPPGYLSPLLVVRTFGDEVWKLTVNEIAFGVGMLGGGAAIAAWGGWRDRMRMLIATSFAFGALTIATALSGNIFGSPGNFPVYLFFMMFIGVAVAYYSTTGMTLFQEQVEMEMQGRVFGIEGIIMAVAMPIGMLVFGPMADVVSIESIMVITGTLAILVTFAAAYKAPQALAPPPASTGSTTT